MVGNLSRTLDITLSKNDYDKDPSGDACQLHQVFKPCQEKHTIFKAGKPFYAISYILVSNLIGLTLVTVAFLFFHSGIELQLTI